MWLCSNFGFALWINPEVINGISCLYPLGCDVMFQLSMLFLIGNLCLHDNFLTAAKTGIFHHWYVFQCLRFQYNYTTNNLVDCNIDLLWFFVWLVKFVLFFWQLFVLYVFVLPFGLMYYRNQLYVGAVATKKNKVNEIS